MQPHGRETGASKNSWEQRHDVAYLKAVVEVRFALGGGLVKSEYKAVNLVAL